MKTCVMCPSKKPLKKEVRAHKYNECGLDYVTIKNLEVFGCQECGEQYLSFPHVEDLHRQIAKAIVLGKKELSGTDFKFLRKRLGFSRTQMAKLLKVTYAHLNRVEMEHKGHPVTTGMDNFVRSLVLQDIHCSPYELLDSVESRSNLNRVVVSQKGETWELAA
jgi:YgiT-type zinc finger domain-containing protein